MNTEARDEAYTQEELDGNAEAVRETVAEWLRLNAHRIVSGDYMEDLTEDVSPDQERVRNLAYMALQANEMVHRLLPSEVRPVRDAANDLTGELEEAIRDAFEALGMDREIPEDFIASASDDAILRLKMKRLGA